MEEDDFQKFSTGLGQVLEYVKYSRSKEELAQHVASKKRFRSVDYESASLINLLTNSGLRLGVREERVDMCVAIDEMRKESRAEGRAEGMFASVRNLMASLSVTAELAMDLLGVAQEDRPAIVALLEQGA